MLRLAEAYRGVHKGRWALLELGRQQPLVMDSAASDWDTKLYGEELGRKKPQMSFTKQVMVLSAPIPGTVNRTLYEIVLWTSTATCKHGSTSAEERIG